MDDYLDKVLEVLQAVSGRSVEDGEIPLRRYCVTSLELGESIAELEDIFDIEIPDRMTVHIENARDLALAVKACVEEG